MVLFFPSSPDGDPRSCPIKGKLMDASADARMDSCRAELSATPSPALDSEELYWGLEYEARTTYLDCGSRSPQPSESDFGK